MKGFSTREVHDGEDVETCYGAHNFPIYQTSTYVFKNVKQGAERFAGKDCGFRYTRMGNPTIRAFEKKIASLEEGNDAVAFSSGMAAISSAFLTLVKTGDHIISNDTVYGGTDQLYSFHLPKLGIEVSKVDTRDASKIERFIKDNTKLIFIETPANPNLNMTNIRETAKIAKKHNIPLIVDNTFMTPYFQKPLLLGADVAMHSCTKYLGGHGDIIGGVIVAKKEFCDRLRTVMIDFGMCMSPFNAWLILRGMKTLSLRMEKHNENAIKVAKFLQSHQKIKRVDYPGLDSFPQHELAINQMTGFGGMISFQIKGGLKAGEILLNNVKLCQLAVSLGCTETLIQHPALLTHARIPKEERERIGISDDLVRLSVGIEDADDIIDDLKQALEKV